MDRESLLLLAVSLLVTAAAVVGISGWVLFARDRRLAKAATVTTGARGAHPEAPEER